MYSSFKLAAKYIRYYITASNGKGHGIHSPFVFDFIEKVLNDKRNFYAYKKVEAFRTVLLMDRRVLEVEDFGAGSITGNKKQRPVAAIAKSAVKSEKAGQLLFRIVNYYQPSTIAELGTSLGLSSMYLAMGNTNATLTTFEGAAAVLAVAKECFSLAGVQNIQTIQGNFDETLPLFLKNSRGIDAVFIDGNHRKEPTLRYFQQLLPNMNRPSVLIFDDIHWSEEMEAAWQSIKDHPDTMLTIDLFFIGLVFFNSDFKVKQHFVIRF